jgi:tight adherence protein C
MDFLLLGACFLFVLSAVLAGGYWFLREPEPEAAVPSPALLGDGDDSTLRETLERIGSVVQDDGQAAQVIRKKLAAAGYRDSDSVRAFFGVKALCSLLFGLAFLGVALLLESRFGSLLLFAVSGCGLGYFLPEHILRMRAHGRQTRLRQGIPPALDLLVLGLEAGQGIDGAMLDASRELKSIYPELSQEFALTFLEMRAGQSRAEVLNHLATRTGEAEIRKLATLLLDGDRFGTSLGPALRTHARYLRTQRRQAAQEQARKTSVKLVFPVFFLIFPSVLVVTLGPAILRLSAGLSNLLNAVK